MWESHIQPTEVLSRTKGKQRITSLPGGPHAGTSVFSCLWGFPGGSDGKESACSIRGLGSIPGSERSPGEGNGNLH